MVLKTHQKEEQIRESQEAKKNKEEKDKRLFENESKTMLTKADLPLTLLLNCVITDGSMRLGFLVVKL